MKKSTPSAAVVPAAIVEDAWQDVSASFERFCLTAGLATLSTMMEEDAVHLCGPRYGRADSKTGHRWGTTKGKVGFHGGKVEIERPRVRARDGGELVLPSWEFAMSEDLLGRWALNLMLINVSTRKFGRAVRLPGGDIAAPKGAGVTKSAVSRRFVALSAERMKEWMAADLSKLDLLVIQIDGIHIKEDLMLLAAVGIDGDGRKHPLGVIEGATENAAVVQALLDNLVGRGLDPAICRLFIIDGAKALSKAIRNTFGRHTPIQRCQVHKARNTGLSINEISCAFGYSAPGVFTRSFERWSGVSPRTWRAQVGSAAAEASDLSWERVAKNARSRGIRQLSQPQITGRQSQSANFR